MVDFEGLVKILIKEIRGPYSQLALSKKLGYSYNQFYRWESGRLKISWREFIRLCNAQKVPLVEAFSHYLHYNGSLGRYEKIIKTLSGSLNATSLATLTGFKKELIDRWKLNRSEPTADEILQFIESTSGFGLDIARSLTSSTKIIEIVERGHAAQKLKDLIVEYPFIPVVELMLASPEYRNLKRHSPSFIAKRIGTSRQIVDQLLSLMEKHGLIAFSKGHYTPLYPTIRTKTPRFDQHAKVIRYWLSHAERILTAQSSVGFDDSISRMNYRVLGVSKPVSIEIDRLFEKFYYDVGHLIQSDDGEVDTVRVMAMQIFDPTAAKLF